MEYRMRNGLIICFLFTAVFFFCPPPNQCHAAVLQGIDVVSSDESTIVTLRIDEEVRSQHGYLPASDSLPARCYVDLYSTNLNQSIPALRLVDDQRLSKVRTGNYPTKLRIVLDLQKDYACTVISSATAPFQIQISVTSSSSLDVKQEAISQPVLSETETQLSTEPSSDETTDIAETDSQLSAFTAMDNEGISAWGWAQYYSAHDTRKDDAEDHKLSRLRGRLGADWDKELNPDNMLEVHAAIDLDRIYYDADLADGDTDFKLHETYLQLNGSDWDISFGKQRVRWGKSDQLSPVDSINPQDLRQFVTVDLEERALPSWMMRNRWYGESIGIETIVQPWFQESEIEYFDSDWALYRNLRQAIIGNPLAPPELKDYIRDLRVDEDEPGKTLGNMSAAARFTWKTEQSDFAVSYHYGWETLPTITSFPVKNLDYSGEPDPDLDKLLEDAVFTNEKVQSKYKRQGTVGFEWETVLEPIGFRGEIAYIDHVAFLTSDFTSKRKPVTHLVSGIDYTSENEWYFNLQGSWFHIYDYSNEILYFEDNTVSALGEIRKPVWRGNLELAIQYNYTITDQSSYLQPSATLKYFPNLECEIGADIFSGDGDTLLGFYGRADQVYGRVKISF
jgi:hypothetical protein